MLLEFFFQIDDPTTKNRQGNDTKLSLGDLPSHTTKKRIALNTIATSTHRTVARQSGHRTGPPACSGRPNPNIRITCCATLPATPATTSDLTGKASPPQHYLRTSPRYSTGASQWMYGDAWSSGSRISCLTPGITGSTNLQYAVVRPAAEEQDLRPAFTCGWLARRIPRPWAGATLTDTKMTRPVEHTSLALKGSH